MRRPRSPSSDGSDTVDVLLVEGDEQDSAADELALLLHELALEAMAWRATWPGEERPPLGDDVPPGEPAPGLGRRLLVRYRRPAAVVAALAVAVSTTTAVVDARRATARAAALVAMPAVLADASAPPSELWRTPGRIVSHQHDRLLVVDDGTLRAVDPATGTTAWTASPAAGRAADDGGCFPVDESLWPDRAPEQPVAGPAGRLACVGHGGADASPVVGAGPGPHIVAVDSATGRTEHVLDAPGALLHAEPAGRDLVVVSATPDARVRVTRWDLAAGTARWETASPEPVRAVRAGDAVARGPETLTIGTFGVDLASGAVLDADAVDRAPNAFQQHPLPDGARATWTWQGDGSWGRGRVTEVSAGRSYTVPGPVLRPLVGDGSDGVLLVRTVGGERLRGLNLGTGRMRWTQYYRDASSVRATALVEGVVLLEDRTKVTALEVATGDHLWVAPVDAGATGGVPLTDGTAVLLPQRTDGVLELVARRIADGAPLWRTEAPAGTRSLTVVDHHLVASTGEEVVGLGTAPGAGDAP